MKLLFENCWFDPSSKIIHTRNYLVLEEVHIQRPYIQRRTFINDLILSFLDMFQRHLAYRTWCFYSAFNFSGRIFFCMLERQVQAACHVPLFFIYSFFLPLLHWRFMKGHRYSADSYPQQSTIPAGFVRCHPLVLPLLPVSKNFD